MATKSKSDPKVGDDSYDAYNDDGSLIDQYRPVPPDGIVTTEVVDVPLDITTRERTDVSIPDPDPSKPDDYPNGTDVAPVDSSAENEEGFGPRQGHDAVDPENKGVFRGDDEDDPEDDSHVQASTLERNGEGIGAGEIEDYIDPIAPGVGEEEGETRVDPETDADPETGTVGPHVINNESDVEPGPSADEKEDDKVAEDEADGVGVFADDDATATDK